MSSCRAKGLMSIAILTYHLRTGLPSRHFLSGRQTTTFHAVLLFPTCARYPARLSLSLTLSLSHHPNPWRCAPIHKRIIINSFITLSYDRSVASSTPSAIVCCPYHVPVSSRSLRSSSVPAYVFFLVFPSLLSFPLSCVIKMWPIQLAFLLLTLCRIFCSLTVYDTSSFLTR